MWRRGSFEAAGSLGERLGELGPEAAWQPLIPLGTQEDEVKPRKLCRIGMCARQPEAQEVLGYSDPPRAQ